MTNYDLRSELDFIILEAQQMQALMDVSLDNTPENDEYSELTEQQKSFAEVLVLKLHKNVATVMRKIRPLHVYKSFYVE